MLKRMTIIGPAHNKRLPGYERFTVYRAKLQEQHLGQAKEVYYMSQDYLTPQQQINIDIENDTEPLRDSFNSIVDGMKVYVQREAIVQPSGQFLVKKLVPADGPIEYFKFHDIDRSKVNLFETEHDAFDSKKATPARVFSEEMFMGRQNIPANELTRIFRRGAADEHVYLPARYETVSRTGGGGVWVEEEIFLTS